jgi:hypothetical protein
MHPSQIIQDEEASPSAHRTGVPNVPSLSSACRLTLKVVPGSKQSEIVGPLGAALKIRVAQPPEAGAANAAVRELLAHALHLHPRNITIVSGHASPNKVVRVAGLSASAVAEALGLAR